MQAYYDAGGLIGYCTGAKIKVVSCNNNGNIEADQYRAGAGLIGYASSVGNLEISQSSNTGNITGKAGIIGALYSGQLRIEDVENRGNLTLNSSSGGIAGELRGSVYLSNVKNIGDFVSIGGDAGGIIGQLSNNSTCTIKDAINTSAIMSEGNYSYRGGIIGLSSGTVSMERCSNTGNITGSEKIGGLVGDSDGATFVKSCFNTGDVIATYDEIGGLIGDSSYTVIESSYNTGMVQTMKSGEGVGGLIGWQGSSINILNCYNSGAINVQTTSRGDVGGLVGKCNSGGGTIKNSNNFGNIVFQGNDYNCIGGIVGEDYSSPYISYCTNYGTIQNVSNDSKDDYVGGIIGYQGNPSTISRCLNVGAIIERCGKFSNYVGGIVGYSGNRGNIEKSYNIGSIVCNGDTSSTYIYIGGLSGHGGTIKESHNEGGITNTAQSTSIYMGGLSGCSNYVEKSYNTGNINCYAGSENLYIGGALGMNSNSTTIKECYNEGNINNASNIANVYMGGIIGQYIYSNNPISDVYNSGQITNTQYYGSSKETCYVGGIAGDTRSPILNCYDVGSVYSGTTTSVSSLGNNYEPYVGPIYGKESSLSTSANSWNNNFYNEDINVVYSDIKNNNNLLYCTVCEEENMRTEDFCNKLKGDRGNSRWLYIEDEYPILDIGSTSVTDGATEITVKNKKKTFDITTEIGKNELGTATGGTISGDYNTTKYLKSNNITYVETVEYGESNKEEINITPIENYMIQRVTLNGKEIEFSTDDEGNCTIPENHFKNITENYHIVAYFIPKQSVLTINKKDEEENKLAGAVFKIESDSIGKEYILGDLHENGTYGFTKGEENKLIPNNKGFVGTTAKSYYIIDLRGREDKTKVKVTAEYEGPNKLYAMITESSEASEYNEDDAFMTLGVPDETKSETEGYVTSELAGGKVYYLHLGYICSSAEADTTGPEISKVELLNTDGSEQHDMFMVRETNANGQIVLKVPAGTYKVTEIQAPEGYELNTDLKECVVGGEETDNGNCVVNVTNTKLREVVIHYYLKDSNKVDKDENEVEDEPNAHANNSIISGVKEILNETTPQPDENLISLKEDVHIFGNSGDEYNTSQYVELELQGYTLEVDENNQYIIPPNASGTFKDDVIHVNYYYEKTSEQLTDLSIEKQWYLPEDLVNSYRATLRLMKVENERLVPVTDSNGDYIEKVVRGNGTAIMENLPKFENGVRIQYKVQEVKVEKLDSINNETQVENWVEVPLEQFMATYKTTEKE